MESKHTDPQSTTLQHLDIYTIYRHQIQRPKTLCRLWMALPSGCALPSSLTALSASASARSMEFRRNDSTCPSASLGRSTAVGSCSHSRLRCSKIADTIRHCFYFHVEPSIEPGSRKAATQIEDFAAHPTYRKGMEAAKQPQLPVLCVKAWDEFRAYGFRLAEERKVVIEDLWNYPILCSQPKKTVSASYLAQEGRCEF